MNNERNYSSIPSTACTLVVGEFELGSNGDGAKSAPVRLVARSGKPIEHWYWGRVVHDLAGMHLHKSRLAIDYVHDSKEVIGYLNKFDIESGDLVTSGALVPYKDNDRASEILHKMSAGVPYEASINFGGDGIKVQEIDEGQVAEVNGYTFEGPGVIVREWPLRGVAICPYGADANTDSRALSGNQNQVFSASVVSEPTTANEEDSSMSQSVDNAAEVEAPEVEATQGDAVEAVTDETSQDEASVSDAVESTGDVVDAEWTVEDEPAESETQDASPVEMAVVEEPQPEPTQLSRDEFARIADEFGAEIAVQTVKDGGDYQTALKAAYDALKTECEHLRSQVASEQCGSPTPVEDAGKPEKAKLFNTGK